ncbi:unnamed protein product [Cuscuta campestris]|uniref:Uncharacterized protein n=1 Tax=Cuscuta campestris TaxID=132261 RepID=A0A484LLN6_9ASTE|nr:unnamed protein product [Cuscuta campestris]
MWLPEGEVVKVSQLSIHIIVLGFSSAIISDDDIHGKYKYKIKHGEEVFVSNSHRRHKIKGLPRHAHIIFQVCL